MAKRLTTSMFAPVSSANRRPFSSTLAQWAMPWIAVPRQDVLFEDGVEDQGDVQCHDRLTNCGAVAWNDRFKAGSTKSP